jgi:putative membrane-bound dehydrogenase-like protein
MFPKVIASVSLVTVLISPLLEAKELDGIRAAAATPCPTVDEAIAKMKVPEGYAVVNFASEPMVINPVAMTWDHRGRLWVVELYEYPSGAKLPNEYSKTATDESFRPVIKTEASSPRDRVLILEDTDNDGKADKRTVFLEGLNLATAILCGHDGVYIGQAPNLFYFRDTNGDDKADEYKTVLTGFGLEDRHELLNSFTWGPDGWMYFTHGVFTNSKVRRPTAPKDSGNKLDAGIYRVQLVAGADGPEVKFHEVFSDGTSNPWGCDFDAKGNWFVEACVIDHLFHMAPGGLYQRQGGAPENPYAYELLPSIVNHKHFRAAYAGIQVYQGGRYPEDAQGHLFFGNIHDNAIHQEAVDPVGATFKARKVRDFLRANDGWFRPVSIQTGPDGFLWVMDWCDKYPCYQNALANPEGVDREKGRIWRVVYQAKNSADEKLASLGSRPEKDLNLLKDSETKLISRLSSKNSWEKRMASLALRSWVDKNLPKNAGSPASEAFDAKLRTFSGYLGANRGISGSEANQIQGLWSLLTMDRINNTGYLPALSQSEFPDARRAAVLAQADLLNAFYGWQKEDWKWWQQLGGDPHPAVRAAVANLLRVYNTSHLTVGRENGRVVADEITLKDGSKVGMLGTFQALLTASKTPEDKTLPFLIWQAWEPALAARPDVYLSFLAKLAPETKPLSESLVYKSARRITDTRSAENMDLLLKFLDELKADETLVARALDGMLKAQEAGAVKPAKTDAAPYFTTWSKSAHEPLRNASTRLATLWGDPNAVAGLMGLVLDEKAAEPKRIEAIQTIRKLKSDAARAGILKLLSTKSSDALTLEALRAAAELGGKDLAQAILGAWTKFSPAVKSAAAEVMVSRNDWAEKLLDAVEGKWISSEKIPASDISVTVRRYYAGQGNKELKERAVKLLGSWNETAANIKTLISAKRKASLAGEPNLEMGKLLFTASCATCHEFHGGGQKVGPELIGSGRSSLDALLNNVIDPNQIIGNGYENIIINTKDNRTLAGRMIEDTPTQVTLLGIGGRQEVIARGDIAKLENTHQSLMPMGFGDLPDEAFRDLIWYILAPPEEGPLTPAKKAALAEPVTEVIAKAPSKGEKEYPKIDWESVSLWNPDWRVVAPEFEGTPTKLTDYAGKNNVLQMHPYPDKTTPARLVRKLTLPADKSQTLKFQVASGASSGWELRVVIDGKEVKREAVGPKPTRWQEKSISLEPWKGKTIEISLENHANGWAWEFSYWRDLRIE